MSSQIIGINAKNSSDKKDMVDHDDKEGDTHEMDSIMAAQQQQSQPQLAQPNAINTTTTIANISAQPIAPIEPTQIQHVLNDYFTRMMNPIFRVFEKNMIDALTSTVSSTFFNTGQTHMVNVIHDQTLRHASMAAMEAQMTSLQSMVESQLLGSAAEEGQALESTKYHKRQIPTPNFKSTDYKKRHEQINGEQNTSTTEIIKGREHPQQGQGIHHPSHSSRSTGAAPVRELPIANSSKQKSNSNVVSRHPQGNDKPGLIGSMRKITPSLLSRRKRGPPLGPRIEKRVRFQGLPDDSLDSMGDLTTTVNSTTETETSQQAEHIVTSSTAVSSPNGPTLMVTRTSRGRGRGMRRTKLIRAKTMEDLDKLVLPERGAAQVSHSSSSSNLINSPIRPPRSASATPVSPAQRAKHDIGHAAKNKKGMSRHPKPMLQQKINAHNVTQEEHVNKSESVSGLTGTMLMAVKTKTGLAEGVNPTTSKVLEPEFQSSATGEKETSQAVDNPDEPLNLTRPRDISAPIEPRVTRSRSRQSYRYYDFEINHGRDRVG